MRAAIEAAKRKRRVVVLNHGPVGRSGTTPMAMEAFQAACLPEDSPELHFRDTVEGGRFLGDENLIRALVENAPARAQDLERYGVHFKRKADGGFDPMHHPGQTHPRALFLQGGGFGLLQALIAEARNHSSIQIRSDGLALALVPGDDGIPSGAIYLDLRDGRMKTVQSAAVVLATGGYQELWAFNDAAITACGDGLMLAYEAGAELVDLEMVQFYPAVVIHPPSIKGTLFQYELVIHPDFLGGQLINGRGERFFEGLPLRDALCRALWRELQGGRGTENGGIWIDLTHSSKSREELTAALEKWQPNQFHYLKDMGFDLRDVRVEVGPHAHFCMGGVQINDRAETTVAGLFACGEVAGNLHGANRVSGNALSETQVFGALAGSSAAAFSLSRRPCRPADFSAALKKACALLECQPLPRSNSIRPHEIIQKLKNIMWTCCGIERNGKDLEWGIKELDRLENEGLSLLNIDSSGPFPQEKVQAFQARWMIALARLVLNSAQYRKETRGSHCRTDFPEPKPRVEHVSQKKERGPWEKPVVREKIGERSV